MLLGQLSYWCEATAAYVTYHVHFFIQATHSPLMHASRVLCRDLPSGEGGNMNDAWSVVQAKISAKAEAEAEVMPNHHVCVCVRVFLCVCRWAPISIDVPLSFICASV